MAKGCGLNLAKGVGVRAGGTRRPVKVLPILRWQVGLLECERHLGPEERNHSAANIVTAREEDLTPEMTADMLAEGVLRDGLSEMATEVAALSEQARGDSAKRLTNRCRSREPGAAISKAGMVMAQSER